MLHKAGSGLITLIRDNITFTTTDIPLTINTHNTELQMVKVHINNTKHITISNIVLSLSSKPYVRPKTHIQHTHSKHLRISTQATPSEKSTHSNRMT